MAPGQINGLYELILNKYFQTDGKQYQASDKLSPQSQQWAELLAYVDSGRTQDEGDQTDKEGSGNNIDVEYGNTYSGS